MRGHVNYETLQAEQTVCVCVGGGGGGRGGLYVTGLVNNEKQ